MNWKNYFCKPLLDKQQIELNETLVTQSNKILELKGEISQLKLQIKENDSVVLVAKSWKKQLDQLKETDPNEEFWNSKRPKINQNYIRHETDGDYQIDVRNFFTEYDNNIPVISGTSYDDIAFKSLVWVIENVKYISDKTDYNFDEYWAYAYQTLKRKKGDCEDGAILLANIMLRSGIPYWRIRLNAGSVNGGGHCYCTYCRETDNNWVVLDWCYWESYKKMSERPLHKDEQNYSDSNKNYYIWFSFNQKYCFGNMDTMIDMPKKVFKNGKTGNNR